MRPPAGLFRQPFRMDLLPGAHNDHRPAADLAIVIEFRRQLIQRRHGDLEHLKTCRTCDFGEFHPSASPGAAVDQPGNNRGVRRNTAWNSAHGGPVNSSPGISLVRPRMQYIVWRIRNTKSYLKGKFRFQTLKLIFKS